MQVAFYCMAIIVTVNEIGLASDEKVKCCTMSFDKNGMLQSCKKPKSPWYQLEKHVL
jgi:hypothetical protein